MCVAVLQRCGVGDASPITALPGGVVEYCWVTVERAPAIPAMPLPAGVAETGPGRVVLCRGTEGGVAVAGLPPAAVADWASGFLPSWPE